jgi:hypothetical protein
MKFTKAVILNQISTKMVKFTEDILKNIDTSSFN